MTAPTFFARALPTRRARRATSALVSFALARAFASPASAERILLTTCGGTTPSNLLDSVASALSSRHTITRAIDSAAVEGTFGTYDRIYVNGTGNMCTATFGTALANYVRAGGDVFFAVEFLAGFGGYGELNALVDSTSTLTGVRTVERGTGGTLAGQSSEPCEWVPAGPGVCPTPPPRSVPVAAAGHFTGVPSTHWLIVRTLTNVPLAVGLDQRVMRPGAGRLALFADTSAMVPAGSIVNLDEWLAGRTGYGTDTCVCGNGRIEGDEVCDDGNALSNDGCSSTCRVEAGATCTGTPSVCADRCGNGLVARGELCDDGNNTAGDGCSATCTVEAGYHCVSTWGARSTCRVQCGDGILATGEGCDDGNVTAGDGCSATCTIESGFQCMNPRFSAFVTRAGRADCFEAPHPLAASASLPTRLDVPSAPAWTRYRMRFAAGAANTVAAPDNLWQSAFAVQTATGAFTAGNYYTAPVAQGATPATATADSANLTRDFAVATAASPVLRAGFFDTGCANNSNDPVTWRVDTMSVCSECRSNADCAGARPVCNLSTGRCVACNGVTNGATCTAPRVCATTGANAGQCVACTSNAQCGGATPICNLTTNLCGGCTRDADCPSATPACVLTGTNAGRCVPCTTDSHCARPLVCNTATNTCAGCNSNADCMGATPICDTASRMCRACDPSRSDCGGDTPACATAGTNTGRCVQCTGANTRACTGATPRCDDPSNTCVACLQNSDCADPTRPVCDRGRCRACAADTEASDCPDATLPVCATRGVNAGRCVACATGRTAACPMERPACDDPTNTCVTCVGDGDCRAPRPACVVAMGERASFCATCLTDAHCAGRSDGLTRCNTTARECVACTERMHCVGNARGAACLAGTCGCEGAGDCAAGQVCDVTARVCVPAPEPVDAGTDAGTDAGVDGGVQRVEFLGSGCGCRANGAGGGRGGVGMLLALAAMAGVRRRRR